MYISQQLVTYQLDMHCSPFRSDSAWQLLVGRWCPTRTEYCSTSRVKLTLEAFRSHLRHFQKMLSANLCTESFRWNVKFESWFHWKRKIFLTAVYDPSKWWHYAKNSCRCLQLLRSLSASNLAPKQPISRNVSAFGRTLVQWWLSHPPFSNKSPSREVDKPGWERPEISNHFGSYRIVKKIWLTQISPARAIAIMATYQNS